jgi:dolichol-phosphate mannosyltransferase
MLSIVIPAYNEADALRRYPAELLPALTALGRPFEVVIVDDGSADETQELARAMGSPVRVVPHPENRGLSAAVQTGIAAAAGELVVLLDADLTFAPALIARLLERFDRGDVDVVSGSPKLAGFADDIPRWRVAVSRVATRVYSGLLGGRITSISPIFRLYRREHLLEILPVRARGFEINAEILFELIKRGRRVAEVPAPLTQRLTGTSKLDYRKELARNARLAGRIARWRLGIDGQG